MQRVRVSLQQTPVHKLGDAHMTVAPKFKLNVIQSSLSGLTIETKQSDRDPSLIPGLPDDISLSCLLRLPVASHMTYKIVCKGWYALFSRKEKFFVRRKELGFKDPWLYVFASHKGIGKIQCQVLDLMNSSWHSIPAMPYEDKVCPHGIGFVSVPHKGMLYVCGGWITDLDYCNSVLNSVFTFEVLKNQWTVMNKMLYPRTFFASEMINGKIYVSGGNSSDLKELNSAEILDPSDGNGSWVTIANMGTDINCFDSAVLNGKLLVTEGWFWPFNVEPRGQVYDPKIDKWEDMSCGLREGWTGLSVVLFNRLFVVPVHEMTKLKVYDVNTDTWEYIPGSALPEQMCKPFSVSCSDRQIFVVGCNLHVAIGDVKVVSEQSNGVKMCFFVEWHVVRAPFGFSDLIPLDAKVLFH